MARLTTWALAWAARILWLLIYVQELTLHALGLPHFEARNYDPLLLRHLCDNACTYVQTRMRRT